MIPVKLSKICEILGCKLDSEDTCVTGVSMDSRTVKRDELFVAVVGETYDAHDFIPGIKECAAIVCERKIDGAHAPQLCVKSSVEALGKIGENNFISAEIPLTVALTGSVGKTTTKEMCALVLSTKYNTFKTQGNRNNHIGLPLTLLSLNKSCEAFVCEMGMNHSGELSYLSSLFTSDVAIITNIGNSHIENLGSRQNIAKAKLEILEGLKSDGTLIINGDEPLLEGLLISQRIVRVGMGKTCDVYAENVESSETGVDFDAIAFGTRIRVHLPVPGKHNVYNAMFAIALGCVSGIEAEISAKALADYAPAGMRQKIYEKSGCLVVADCYNASIESMLASLEALRDMKKDRHTVAVLGDMREVGDKSEEFHRMVGRKAAECGIDTVIAFGNDARFIAEDAGGESFYFDNKEKFAEKICEYLDKSPVILFKASRAMEFEKIISLVGLSQE